MEATYFDINGEAISQLYWIMKFNDPDYRRIGWSRVGWGPNKKRVSTVWLGLNHSYLPHGTPIIFESMVFLNNASGESAYQARYTRREEAVSGHAQLVKKYQYNRAQRRRKGIP